MTKATTPDTGQEMETITSADGTEIAFERTGSGPPLVLITGGATNDHTRWEQAGVRPTFAEHCTVYAMDGRGRGESGDADEYALEREVEDVTAVVDAVDGPVTLLGHSVGALYPLEAALRTDNLGKLILYEPPIAVGDHELGVEEVVTEIETLLNDGEKEQALVLFLQAVGGLSPEELDALCSAPTWQDRVDVAHIIPRGLQAADEYEFDASRFAGLTTPTLLLSGSESPPLYKDGIEALNKALPNSRIVTFDGHAHVAILTATDRFIDEVLAFTRESN
ncbi:alpha/beta hydrolase [Halostagnicola sp. A-GB9-2]|uniref:alpha/beta fold hydrolase n=1 Tax=Halostagnicola sp. A-GB9-2 TaxID=3048066 RepID=UPI0024BF9A90|nr:alpha/beta hydrolase [Halostagnicola sp. A-GB9-2]MDJ1430556.1 alpha/beta hydrolase [Halostagnicola sp. A-GB9-2]